MKQKTEETVSNSFLLTLGQVRKGQSAGELSESLAEVVTAVRCTGKGGVLTLKLKITPNKDGISVNVEDEIVVKLPKMERQATLFYSTEEGHLQRNDPAQAELFPHSLKQEAMQEACEREEAENENAVNQ